MVVSLEIYTQAKTKKKETLWDTEKIGGFKHHNGYWWTSVLSKHLSEASDFGLSFDRLLTTGWSWTLSEK